MEFMEKAKYVTQNIDFNLTLGGSNSFGYTEIKFSFNILQTK